jgi:hypothetical protein
MPDAIDLLAILAELGAVDFVLHRSDPTLEVAIVQLPDDHRVLAVERTYRSGVCVIVDPTEEEMVVAREGDLWRLWNSERAKDLLELRQSLELKSPGSRSGAPRQVAEGGP